MKREERKHRLGLTILMASIIFGILLLSIVCAVVLLYLLMRWGIVHDPSETTASLDRFILFMAAISLLAGAVVAAIGSRISLKPVNKLITQMNRLASGDFRARLTYEKPFGTHPTAKEVTEAFNTMAQELESTEMLRSDFVNNFSHEFKTPIVSIAGFAKLLNRGNLNPEQQKEYLRIIEEESLRLSQMATNVLNLTKVENQTILSDVTRFNLSEQLRSCVLLLLEGKWSKKDISFDIDIDEYFITANEELLRQVWLNLLDNAVKFSDDDEAVDVRVFPRGDTVSVHITNVGSQIPLDQQEKIFHKFYQIDQSHASEGNGIGLALVKRIVDLHGGTVQVESGQNITTFVVNLPWKAN